MLDDEENDDYDERHHAATAGASTSENFMDGDEDDDDENDNKGGDEDDEDDENWSFKLATMTLIYIAGICAICALFLFKCCDDDSVIFIAAKYPYVLSQKYFTIWVYTSLCVLISNQQVKEEPWKMKKKPVTNKKCTLFSWFLLIWSRVKKVPSSHICYESRYNF